MLTIDDIKLIVASGEGYNAEFKVSVPSKVRDLSEEVCAFANAAGGVVLIGVDDTNRIVGTSIDNAKRSAIQQSIGDISPALHCTLSMMDVDGKTIGVIEVPSGANKPYVLSGAIFVRIGPNSQKLTSPEQMRDFFQQSGKIYFDEAGCKAFDSTVDVDTDILQLFKSLARITDSTPDEQIYKNLRLLTDNHLFKNGAVLFFGKQPELIFEKAVVRCLLFKGKDKRFIIDDKLFGGSLYRQYTKAMQWLKEKLNVGYDIEGQGAGPRKEIWEIPETVFKEAIINSLSHRDYYDKGAVTMIEIFDDRVEISNPGGLVSAIKPADFGKRSHSRNPLIFGLFARMQLVEQVGSGINRMNDLMKSAGLMSPEYSTDGMFTIKLLRPTLDGDKLGDKLGDKTSTTQINKALDDSEVESPLGDKLGDKSNKSTREMIVEMINQDKNVTTEVMAENLRLTIKGIEYHIAKLQKEKVISRVGSRKTGYWKLL
jgi:ATP-dependent DNA helicase RecG